MEDNCLFISARERINMDELKSVVYQRVKELLLNSQAVRNWNEAKNYHDKILSQRRMAFSMHSTEA